jgi:transposase
MEITEQQ